LPHDSRGCCGPAAAPLTLARRGRRSTLHQLGIDPNRLAYFFGGLDQKLVGVEGAEPIRELIA
jgi:hypothetical protein